MNDQPLIVAGVDTHKDTHYAAVISATGAHLGAAQFPATDAGYRALHGFITGHGELLRAGVEGTNSYGAGLTRHLHQAGAEVVEVSRPARQTRRMRGKSEELDAYAAAHIALADNDTVTAKTGTGTVEAIRVTNAARRSAMKARNEVIVQLESLIVTAPEQVRAEYGDLTTSRLITRLTGSRARVGDDEVASRTRTALKRLAGRYQQLDEEITGHDTVLVQLVDTINPGLVQTHGIKTVTAAQLLAIARLATDPDARVYAGRLTAAGKTKKDILRCLKRAIARQVFHLRMVVARCSARKAVARRITGRAPSYLLNPAPN